MGVGDLGEAAEAAASPPMRDEAAHEWGTQIVELTSGPPAVPDEVKVARL